MFHFRLLLRQSSATGGGDYGGTETQTIEMTAANASEALNDLMAKGLAREGMEMPVPSSSVVGSWAGDRVALVGDYDESGLYQDAKRFKNISAPLVAEWTVSSVTTRVFS